MIDYRKLMCNTCSLVVNRGMDGVKKKETPSFAKISKPRNDVRFLIQTFIDPTSNLPN